MQKGVNVDFGVLQGPSKGFLSLVRCPNTVTLKYFIARNAKLAFLYRNLHFLAFLSFSTKRDESEFESFVENKLINHQKMFCLGLALKIFGLDTFFTIFRQKYFTFPVSIHSLHKHTVHFYPFIC